MPYVLLLVLVAGITGSSTRANADEDQRQIVSQYISAYARGDNAQLRHFLACRHENLFGPYPFTGFPTLTKVKVDDNQALVEFTGKVDDNKFHNKGSLLLYRRDGAWQVQQVLFYTKIPGIFNLPKKSVTDQDRQNEAPVRAVTEQFLTAWQAGDTKKVLERWYRWMDRDRDPNKGLSVSNIEITPSATTWGETFVRYKAKLTYRWGILSYSMNLQGGLILVNEDDELKIRGNVMVLYF